MNFTKAACRIRGCLWKHKLAVAMPLKKHISLPQTLLTDHRSPGGKEPQELFQDSYGPNHKYHFYYRGKSESCLWVKGTPNFPSLQ